MEKIKVHNTKNNGCCHITCNADATHFDTIYHEGMRIVITFCEHHAKTAEENHLFSSKEGVAL